MVQILPQLIYIVTVLGHVTSLVTWPSEPPCVVSYRWSIV